MHEAMASWLDPEKSSTEFERTANTYSEDGIARLACPGVEGLQIFFASVADGNPITVEEVRSGYEAKGWSAARSLSWSEVEFMVQFIAKDTTHSDADIAVKHYYAFPRKIVYADNYKKFATLEEQRQVYLAVCIPCESKENAGKLFKCVGCDRKKNRNEFSFARQRCRNYATWRCLDCDFPPCLLCNAKPEIPKKAPYICEPCLYPPCKCGAERPRSTKYRSTNEKMQTWTCSKCREK